MGLQVTGEELRAELSRLHEDLKAAKGGGGSGGEKAVSVTFDADQPAKIPANVPALPLDYEETGAVAELRRCGTSQHGLSHKRGP